MLDTVGDFFSHSKPEITGSITSKGFVEVFSIDLVCAKAVADLSTIPRSKENYWNIH